VCTVDINHVARGHIILQPPTTSEHVPFFKCFFLNIFWVLLIIYITIQYLEQGLAVLVGVLEP
jgi:hypothetical protein